MKTLILGPANAGKTSLLRTTCSGYNYMRVMNIPPTRGISRENYLFRGLLELTLWDAGGQERYLTGYFSDQKREMIFSEVEIPIFVVDSSIPDSEQQQSFIDIFKKFIEYLLEFSPNVKRIFILMNKTDLENANPDKYYELLSQTLSPKQKNLCEFTPVSVKEGSAQHRLIEILDQALQDSVLELEKIANLRAILEKMKEETNAEYIIINRPDGLITTSTFGKIDADALNFLSLDMASLESNIDLIISKIQERMGRRPSAAFLSANIYETMDSYIILSELEDFGDLMVITKEKNTAILMRILEQINKSNNERKSLVKFLSNH